MRDIGKEIIAGLGEMLDMKPCPTCGSDQINRDEWPVPSIPKYQKVYFLQCTKCGHRGESGETEEEAIENWQGEEG